MVKVALRKIPYSLRYLPYGQGDIRCFTYGQGERKEDTLQSKVSSLRSKGNKDSTLQSRGYLKI